MTDLWTMAGEEAEREAAEHKLALARVACAGYWPVLASAGTKDEYDHAKALVSDGVTAAVADISSSPADQAILASRVLDSFDEDWDTHQAARKQAQEAPQGFGFPAEPLPNEAPQLENEIAAWEGTDQQTRVNMGNGIGVADESSGPNVEGPGANPGEMPLLTASAQDIEAGLPEGDYHLDAFGALIPVEGSAWSHLRNTSPMNMSATDIQNHLLLHHNRMSVSDDEDENHDKHMELHGNPGIYGSSRHNHGGPGVSRRDLQSESVRHTAPGGGEHAPYYIREEGGKYKVVNRKGEVKGTHDTKDAARQQQKALYVNVPGATEEAEKYHGHTPKAVSEEGKKASLQMTARELRCTKCGAEVTPQDTKGNYGSCPEGGKHTPEWGPDKEASLQMTALQRQAVQVARSLVDQMPAEAQHHAVAKAMYMRAKGFDLSEDETDLVINAALARVNERTAAIPRYELRHPTYGRGNRFNDLDRAKQELTKTVPEGEWEIYDRHEKKTVASLQKGAPFAGYKDFHDCVRKNQDKDDPEAYCGSIKNQVEGSRSRVGRLWDRLMGRTAQGGMGGMTNPMNPASVANPFSPAQDVNAAMTDTNPTMGTGAAAMVPGQGVPDEIPGQTQPGSATGTAASSKPRTKPSENPNAPSPPPMQQPQGMAPQMLTGVPMMAARVAVADTILANNPGLDDEEALRLAAKTIERYPHLVREAYGGSDYPFDTSGQPYTVCPQCGVEAFDGRTGHCHNCGFVNGAGQVGFDPLSGPTTIAPGKFDMRNPGTR